MRISWATDIHFDHCDEKMISKFVHDVKQDHGEALILAGDISSNGLASKVVHHLQKELHIPVYFILGNHDFYGKSIHDVRSKMPKDLFYLNHYGPITLCPGHALIGHDGWADGRAGDYNNSNVLLNDYVYIEELKDLSKNDRLKMLQKLSKESVDAISAKLHEALKQHTHVLLVTHVPPFHECALHDGQLADMSWAPHFVNIALGRTLKHIMEDHPRQTLTVLSGHTHAETTYRALTNLTVHVGIAEYGSPQLQRSILID